jgi:heterodisulfide reductase subunit B
MCKTLDIKMTEIPDWNCCGASVSYAESGELPRIAMNARNFALAETNLPGQDIVATCAACWLGSRESKERLEHNSKLIESVGGEATKYDQKVTCCGGALAFSEPEKAQAQIKDIIEAAYDSGAEMLVTPCPLCQANTEVYQGQINKKYGTKFNMPVLYYSQLMTLAYGGSAKEAGLNGNVIRASKLEQFAGK